MRYVDCSDIVKRSARVGSDKPRKYCQFSSLSVGI